MQYFDKDGREIKAGMKLLMEDGSIRYGDLLMFRQIIHWQSSAILSFPLLIHSPIIFLCSTVTAKIIRWIPIRILMKILSMRVW